MPPSEESARIHELAGHFTESGLHYKTVKELGDYMRQAQGDPKQAEELEVPGIFLQPEQLGVINRFESRIRALAADPRKAEGDPELMRATFLLLQTLYNDRAKDLKENYQHSDSIKDLFSLRPDAPQDPKLHAIQANAYVEKLKGEGVELRDEVSEALISLAQLMQAMGLRIPEKGEKERGLP